MNQKKMSQPRMKVGVIHRPNEIFDANLNQEDGNRNETTEGIEMTCRESFHQYLLNSTLHGLKYVGDRSLSFIERVFFIITFFLVGFLSAYFICNVYNKWSNSPIIVTLSSTPINTLPFPAVTICNMNQVRKSVVESMDPDSKEYTIVQNLCKRGLRMNQTKFEKIKWSEVQEVIEKVYQPCDDMIVSCKYGGRYLNCSLMFEGILTGVGVCCTFNAVNEKFLVNDAYQNKELVTNTYLNEYANSWTLEEGFGSKELLYNRYSFPRPILGSGSDLGLTLVLNADISEYYCSSTNSFGFKVNFHNPDERPHMLDFGDLITNGFESHFIINPRFNFASNSIKKISLDIRKCRFENENILTIYRTYSQKNCQIECQANMFYSNCHCVPYFIPRFHESIDICGQAQDECVSEVWKEFRKKKNQSFVCDCLSACWGIKYYTLLSIAQLIEESPLIKNTGLPKSNLAVLHAYFLDSYIQSHKKEEYIGFTEFLSNIGGLLGLFMGFSMVSIIELIYFMTFRPYCNYSRIKNRKLKTDNKRLLQRSQQNLIKNEFEMYYFD